jgi:hypothetical protein
MISEGRLNYWWAEIKKEWDCGWDEDTGVIHFKTKQVLNNVFSMLSEYDEKKYPGKEKHDQYINSKKWKLRREGFMKLEILKNDGPQCVLCGQWECNQPKSFTWNLHHNNYDHFAHQFFYQEMVDLVWLCQGCHESIYTNIDTLLQGEDRKIFKGHQNENGKFFDSKGCLKFGKYEGYSIDDVPDTYLQWIEDNTNSEYDLDLIENHW